MTRTAFTSFAQPYLAALLHPFGTVYLNAPVPRDPTLKVFKLPARTDWGTEVVRAFTTGNPHVMISPEVVGEADLVDVLFEPDNSKPIVALGLLGELLSVPCIIEPLRWLPTRCELRTCLRHWLQWQLEETNGLLPLNGTPEDHAPELDEDETVNKRSLVIVPSITAKQLESWGATPDTSSGIYHSPPMFGSTLVVANELSETSSTLWLRLLGRGKTQRRAISDLLGLAADHPLRSIALQQLQQWYRLLSRGQRGRESRRLMHCLSQL